MGDVVEDFYGCYLLVSQNEKYKNRTYVGFTVNPNRRINQHNKGMKAGGAKRTQNKGPWNMILIVHGFPNEISALRFEWAWQHPHLSSRLRNLPKKTSKETQLQYRFRIMEQMLIIGPWNRLPLTIRWLEPEYAIQFKVRPPIHMPITEGDVKSKKITTQADKINTDSEKINCSICGTSIKDATDQFKCFVPACDMKAHVFCLAKNNTDDFVIPIEINCSECKSTLLWGDLVRHQRGCYQNLNS